MRRTLQNQLLSWYQKNKRDLPWRHSSDPYTIWISEIMLQQTRVAAVIPYFQRFLQLFPTVQALAASPEPELLSAWAGLGYYSRARNLHAAAKIIAALPHFPNAYPAIRQLPGVGDYTAAAIASIAFSLPHAVLDGNVMRVLSRLDNDPSDIASPRTRLKLQARAQQLLLSRSPGDFNQAIMELGATICLPKNPLCSACPISQHCAAFLANRQHELPVKLKKTKIHSITRTLLLIENNGRFLMYQRPPSSPKLPGFWELPEIHHFPHAQLQPVAARFRHSITNHNYLFLLARARIQYKPNDFEYLPPLPDPARPWSTTTRKALSCLKICSPGT